VWENRELRRIFGLTTDEETGGCKKSIMKGCIIFTLNKYN
jgi:hypothetical protein